MTNTFDSFGQIQFLYIANISLTLEKYANGIFHRTEMTEKSCHRRRFDLVVVWTDESLYVCTFTFVNKTGLFLKHESISK